MQPARQPVGPIVESAYSVLRGRREFREFQEGGSRDGFAGFLEAIAEELIAAGLPPEDVHFAKRYPRNAVQFVDACLVRLVEEGVIPPTPYDHRAYDDVSRAIDGYYSHGPFRTYIYPEERRLLHAIVVTSGPRNAVFLGSYYGYWAHPALLAIAAAGGRATLVDPDPRAQQVARANIECAGLSGHVDLAQVTGQEFMASSREKFDLVVLDAEGPRDHPDPRQRGKRIYEPLLECALPRMEPGALLVCHNILLTDIANCRWFDRIIERNQDELGPMMQLTRSRFHQFIEFTSTEGTGAGKFKG